MKLQYYEKACYKLDSTLALLEDGSIGATEFSETISEITPALQAERVTGAKELREDCGSLVASGTIGLRRTEALLSRLEGLRSYLSVYKRIEAVLGLLLAGCGNYSGSEREGLTSVLRALYDDTSYLSGECFSVFNSTQHNNARTLRQFIYRLPQNDSAIQLAEKLREEGYLDFDYNPIQGLTEAEKGIIGRGLGRACGHGAIESIKSIWGLKRISQWACNADIQKKNIKVLKLKDIMGDWGKDKTTSKEVRS